MAEDVLTEAIRYGERGLFVSPCGGDKRPIGGWKAATDHTGQIRELWAKYPNANVGLATGPEAGLLVVDIDEKRGGDVDDIERRYGRLPETPMVQTGRGSHIYFAHPAAAIRGTKDRVAAGVEIKSAGQGVIAPPSRHPSGKRYAWEVDLNDAELAPAPDWLIEHTDALQNDRDDSFYSVPFCNTVDDAIVRSVPRVEGERHYRIFHFARLLKAMPAYAEADPRSLRSEFRRWWDSARRVMRTQEWEDSWLDFINAWPDAWPLREDRVMTALKDAEAKPMPEAAGEYDCPTMMRLIALCRELQQAAGDQPFYLSCAKAEEVLDIDRMKAWRRLKLLVADGVLELVEKGTKVRASRYRYHGD